MHKSNVVYVVEEFVPYLVLLKARSFPFHPNFPQGNTPPNNNQSLEFFIERRGGFLANESVLPIKRLPHACLSKFCFHDHQHTWKRSTPSMIFSIPYYLELHIATTL